MLDNTPTQPTQYQLDKNNQIYKLTEIMDGCELFDGYEDQFETLREQLNECLQKLSLNKLEDLEDFITPYWDSVIKDNTVTESVLHTYKDMDVCSDNYKISKIDLFIDVRRDVLTHLEEKYKIDFVDDDEFRSNPNDKKWSKFISLHNNYIDDNGDSISKHFKEYWKKSNDIFKDSFLKDFEIVINLYEKMMNTVDKHTKKLLGDHKDFDYSNFYNLTNDIISHLEGKYKIELYS